MWKYIWKHKKFSIAITVFAGDDEEAEREIIKTIENARVTTLIDLPDHTQWTIVSKAVL
jgi:hypothetical protein